VKLEPAVQLPMAQTAMKIEDRAFTRKPKVNVQDPPLLMRPIKLPMVGAAVKNGSTGWTSDVYAPDGDDDRDRDSGEANDLTSCLFGMLKDN
jgi:hypothetical protein